jgi:hypothetical protein
MIFISLRVVKSLSYTTTTLPILLQLGITVTTSLCITAAHYRQSTNFANGPCIFKKTMKNPLRFRTYFRINPWYEKSHTENSKKGTMDNTNQTHGHLQRKR